MYSTLVLMFSAHTLAQIVWHLITFWICLLGPVLFSDWPAHFRDPLLDPEGPRNAKKPELLKRKNGAPPNFVLYTVIHSYGTSKIEFWQYSI